MLAAGACDRGTKEMWSPQVDGGSPWDVEYPAVVTLYYDPKCTSWSAPPPGIKICSGVLVRPAWVLTAGHCLDQVPACIGVGPVRHFHHGARIYRPRRCTVHPNAALRPVRCGAFGNVRVDHEMVSASDLGLIELSSPVSAQHGRPMRLFDPNGADRCTNVPLRIAGFGQTEKGGSPASGLQIGELSQISPLGDGFVVTAEGALGRKGDSGGPVFVSPSLDPVEDILCGVVTAGSPGTTTEIAPLWTEGASAGNRQWLSDTLPKAEP